MTLAIEYAKLFTVCTEQVRAGGQGGGGKGGEGRGFD